MVIPHSGTVVEGLTTEVKATLGRQREKLPIEMKGVENHRVDRQ